MKKKNVVIIGGTDGIGRALADLLATDNDVLIVGRSQQKGERFIEQHGTSSKFLTTDLSTLNQIPPLVHSIKEQLDKVDFLVHTADILRVKRLDTSEGLEKSIATNYYSRVLFNQLLIGEYPRFQPERIIHVAAAGFPPPKSFINNFPLPEKASSFKGHGMGQLANDFYALFMRERLADLGIKINILNPGTVDTDIRRNGQFPKLVKILSPLIGLVLSSQIRQPLEYAKIPLKIIKNDNPDANEFTLINSKGNGIKGSKNLNDSGTQRQLYEFTKEQIDQILRPGKVTNWL